jgi:ABC-type amino acid transport system permease subunit
MRSLKKHSFLFLAIFSLIIGILTVSIGIDRIDDGFLFRRLGKIGTGVFIICASPLLLKIYLKEIKKSKKY